MAQTNGGLYPVLGLPFVYTVFESAIGALAARRRVIREHVRPKPGERILDIGCGPGDVVRFLPARVQYVGFDESAAYIETARRRFGHRARFYCERVREKTLAEGERFDIVLAFGILHHLDDPEAIALFRLAGQALRPGGRLFTLDGCFVPGQSRWARWLLRFDRGKNVRTQEEYLSLIGSEFTDVQAAIRNDIFWIPYTALVLQCRREGEAASITDRAASLYLGELDGIRTDTGTNPYHPHQISVRSRDSVEES